MFSICAFPGRVNIFRAQHLYTVPRVSKLIPDDVLDRVRQATDIVSLVRPLVPLRKAGAGFVGLCPFHKEKTPSFHVNPERQIFKCFGCGVAGDIFSFVQRTENVSFPEAIELLAERANVQLPDRAEGDYQRGERARLLELNLLATRAFVHFLRQPTGETARKYLASRGLSDDTLAAFQIGYAPEGWDTFLTAARKKGYEAELALKAGLAVSNEQSDRVYDRFRNRLMFPIRDAQERVIGFGARSLDGSEPKYINSPETPLFSKGRTFYGLDRAESALRETKRAIVVEGYMDAVTLHQFGFTNTVAVLGTALSRDHVQILRRHVEGAVLLFDGDAAGLNSASRSVDAFAQEELPVGVAIMPDGMDPDDFVRKEGPAALTARLDSAVDGVTFKLDRALKGRAEVQDARVLDDVLATIALMPNPVAQQQQLRKVAGHTGVPEFRLDERMTALRHSALTKFADTDMPSTETQRRDAEYELLSAVLSHPEGISTVQEVLPFDRIGNAGIRTLLTRVADSAAKGVRLDAGALLATTAEESLRNVLERILGEPVVRVEDAEGWCRELANEIAARALDRASRQMHQRLAGETVEGDDSDRALAERLRAAREAQRARGRLNLRKSL